MFFNRFRIEREAGMRFLQFGLFVSSELIDSFSCSVPEPVVAQHKKALLEYLSRIGPGEKDEEQIVWKGCPPRTTTVVDIINMAHRGNMSEIEFHGFSLHGATTMSRAASPSPIAAEALAFLRSEPHLHKQIIAALYEEG